MRWTRNPARAVLVALALLAGCSGDDSSPSTTTAPGAASTTAAAAPSTAVPADALRSALLTPADVPGSASAISAQQDFDFSTCFPGNPFATRSDPTEVKNPGLQLTEGSVNRQYGSKLRQGTPEQAKAFVTGFASPEGSSCVVSAFKKSVAENPTPEQFDASNLTGTGSPVEVAEGGGLLTISGQLKVGQGVVFTDADLLVFQKGPVVVYVSASGVGGPKVPGQAVELAQRIAGRLP